jgi:HlyD family secretion protein
MSGAPIESNEALGRILAASTKSRPWSRRKRVVAAAVALGVVLLAAALIRSSSRGAAPAFRTQEVTRAGLTVSVSASGNLQPINQVDVGSEVSGTIESIFVDDNDRVRKGQILAILDVSRLQDQVVNAKAALAAAEARTQQAEASVGESRANLARLKQVSELSGGKVPSKAEMETAEATVKRAEADTTSARASVEQAQAALKSALTNLGKASIRSPINGVVLSREIEPGQTVAASFQAPVLFKLAEDLSQMELQVDVDEAEVGQVKDGQKATFNVDAYPGRKYPARITRVGYGSQTKDGVVSYKTVLQVSNSDLSLRPGMTATAEITTAERSGVLLVPNAALRFTPPAAASAAPRRSIVSSLLPRPPGLTARKSNGNGKSGATQVWILREGQPVAVEVKTGLTDGKMTEVTGNLEPGAQVITDTIGAQK